MLALNRLNQSHEFILLLEVLELEQNQLMEQLIDGDGRSLILAQGRAQQLREIQQLAAGAKAFLEQHG